MYQVPFLTNLVSQKAATAYYHRHEGAVLDWPGRTRAEYAPFVSQQLSVTLSDKTQELELA